MEYRGLNERYLVLQNTPPGCKPIFCKKFTKLHFDIVYNNDSDNLQIDSAILNTENELGITPVWLAFLNNKMHFTNKLLNAGANTTIADAQELASIFKIINRNYSKEYIDLLKRLFFKSEIMITMLPILLKDKYRTNADPDENLKSVLFYFLQQLEQQGKLMSLYFQYNDYDGMSNDIYHLFAAIVDYLRFKTWACRPRDPLL